MDNAPDSEDVSMRKELLVAPDDPLDGRPRLLGGGDVHVDAVRVPRPVGQSQERLQQARRPALSANLVRTYYA